MLQLGFGPDFIRWVNIFNKGFQSCIINIDLCSHYFKIGREGPLSPYLFVTAVEILAIAIRNQYDIKGIKNYLET